MPAVKPEKSIVSSVEPSLTDVLDHLEAVVRYDLQGVALVSPSPPASRVEDGVVEDRAVRRLCCR